MKLSQRVVASLIASIVLSAVMILLERARNSEVLFDLQFPGFYACVLIWGFHSSPGNAALGHLVFGAANALAYWPLCFGLSFLFRNGGAKRGG